MATLAGFPPVFERLLFVLVLFWTLLIITGNEISWFLADLIYRCI